MKKLFLFLIFLFIVYIPFVYAHCPLCTMAVGTVAVTAEYYGVDTSVIGLFVGAFAVSLGLWFGLKLKKEYFRFQLAVIVLLSFLLTVVPILYSVESDSIYLPLLIAGSYGSLFNKVYWLNKMLLGSLVGSVITIFGYYLHMLIKRLKGRVLFSYQGIVLTLLLLLISAVALFFIFG